MASENLHENPETLGGEIIDQHRAIVSIMEELEAVDWYNQRAKATIDDELRAILEHNRDEEKEHMAMVLEWLRRHDPKLDENLRKYLFNEKPPLEVEEAASAGADAEDTGSLNIGDLRVEVKK
ncbi:MAG TPA: encapsulin-associated ferritin-like protein [Stellaceae bacterium]